MTLPGLGYGNGRNVDGYDHGFCFPNHGPHPTLASIAVRIPTYPQYRTVLGDQLPDNR
jgi:hypothetical protein